MSAAFLSSDRVALTPVGRADLPRIAAWRHQPDLLLTMREWRPLTDVDQDAWLHRISGANRTDFVFVIRIRKDHTPIGVVSLAHWDGFNANAEIGFYLGEPTARGKGYASAAVQLVQQWGFEILRLRRIYAEVFSFNEPSLALMRRCGYQEEGRLREHVYRMGAWHDTILFGLLYREWHSTRS